jgi:protein-arginine kinase activator protein McsA
MLEIYLLDIFLSIRKKRNDKLRARRLNELIDKAVKEMNFERAAELRDILFK